MDTLNLTLKVGDVLKIGKFKNRTAVIKDFSVDAHGQPTVITDKGELNVFKFRLVNELKSSLKHSLEVLKEIKANRR